MTDFSADGGGRQLLTGVKPEIRQMLPWLILLRLITNTGMRMGYSFLPAFARGAGISQSAMGTVLAVRDLTALSSPIAGRATDRFGTGRIMGIAGIGAALGMALSAAGSVGLIAGFVATGFFAVVYKIALSAWVGHAVAYENRSRITGLIELSWGGSALLGIPLVGLLIDYVGWRAAPALLALLALPLSIFLSKHDSTLSATDPATSSTLTMSRAAVGAISAYTTLTMSAQFLFLGHGLWLEDTHKLSAGRIGLAVFAAAVMEVLATLGSARITDTIGKRQAILLGTGLLMAGLVGLAFFSEGSLVVGVILLAVVFLGFEFAVVSALPLISELDPLARASMIGRTTAISTVFRALISLSAVGIYNRYGFATLMAIAAAFAIASMLLTIFAVEEPVGVSASR